MIAIVDRGTVRRFKRVVTRKVVTANLRQLLEDIDAQIAAEHASAVDAERLTVDRLLRTVGARPERRPTPEQVRRQNDKQKASRAERLRQLGIARDAAVYVLDRIADPSYAMEPKLIRLLHHTALAFGYAALPARTRDARRQHAASSGGTRSQGANHDDHRRWMESEARYRALHPKWSERRRIEAIRKDDQDRKRTDTQIRRGLNCPQCRAVARPA